MDNMYGECWHALAVGLYYRANDASHPACIHWTHQTLAVKLEWQARAKVMLKGLTSASK